MKTYLEKFILPTAEQEEGFISGLDYMRAVELRTRYPFDIFGEKGFSQIDFAPITIFYGGNGSGKSTLLNVITQRLKLRRIAPRNDSELFDEYCALCRYKTGWDEDWDAPFEIPTGSALLTSDDVFEYMFAARMHDKQLDEQYKDAYEFYFAKRGKDKKKAALAEYYGVEDYETNREITLALSRSHSARTFAEKVVGKKARHQSNGETALDFFNKMIKDERLYLLDEPENSLSPKLQTQLAEILETSARACGCQFVIATHSPLLLSLKGAKIYDLDAVPVDVKLWQELENVKIYFEHFEKHRQLFKSEKK